MVRARCPAADHWHQTCVATHSSRWRAACSSLSDGDAAFSPGKTPSAVSHNSSATFATTASTSCKPTTAAAAKIYAGAYAGRRPVLCCPSRDRAADAAHRRETVAGPCNKFIEPFIRCVAPCSTAPPQYLPQNTSLQQQQQQEQQRGNCSTILGMLLDTDTPVYKSAASASNNPSGRSRAAQPPASGLPIIFLAHFLPLLRCTSYSSLGRQLLGDTDERKVQGPLAVEGIKEILPDAEPAPIPPAP